MNKKVQVIEGPDGKPEYAVVPWTDFQRLSQAAEDREDAALIAAARESGEETFPQAVMDRLMDGENPTKVFREYRGMKQSELAQTAGTTATYISQIETGHRFPGRKLLRAIAGALSVETMDLADPDDG